MGGKWDTQELSNKVENWPVGQFTGRKWTVNYDNKPMEEVD